MNNDGKIIQIVKVISFLICLILMEIIGLLILLNNILDGFTEFSIIAYLFIMPIVICKLIYSSN